MKSITKLMGILIASTVLFACDGGSSIKTEKVWKLVERTATGRSGKVSYKYNGSGLLEKQVFSNEYFEFIYNDQGVLLKKEKHNTAGDLIRYEEFDQYGEATSRVAKENGVFKPAIVYKNKYPDSLDIKDKAVQKEIKKYTQRKILQTWLSNELTPYLGSKLVSRTREVSYERIEEFAYNGNERITKVFLYPDDGVADKEFHAFYDKYGVRLFGNEYDYEEDGNGNLKVATFKDSRGKVYYTWEQIAVPVSN